MDVRYPRIPDPPAQQPSEPIEYYGSRLVVWLLEGHDPVTCSDAQLARAVWSTTAALAQRSTIVDVLTPVCVYDRLEAVRRGLQAAIDRRGRGEAPAIVVSPTGPPPPTTDGGHYAKLRPRVPGLSPVGVARQPADDIAL